MQTFRKNNQFLRDRYIQLLLEKEEKEKEKEKEEEEWRERQRLAAISEIEKKNILATNRSVVLQGE